MKVDRSAQISKDKQLSRPRQQFWGPLVAMLDFAGVAVGEQVPPSTLDWYFSKFWCFLFFLPLLQILYPPIYGKQARFYLILSYFIQLNSIQFNSIQ